jgi:hypothetical protein
MVGVMRTRKVISTINAKIARVAETMILVMLLQRRELMRDPDWPHYKRMGIQATD